MPFVLLVIGFAIGFVFAIYLEEHRGRAKRKDLERYEREVQEELLLKQQCEERCPDRASAFEEFNQAVQELIETRKEKILKQLKSEELNSAAVAELLEVSQRTAARYLSELHAAGEIAQHGSGRRIRYALPSQNPDNL